MVILAMVGLPRVSGKYSMHVKIPLGMRYYPYPMGFFIYIPSGSPETR